MIERKMRKRQTEARTDAAAGEKRDAAGFFCRMSRRRNRGRKGGEQRRDFLRNSAVDGKPGHGAQSRERQRVDCAPTDLELLRLTGGDAHLVRGGLEVVEDGDEEEGGDG